MSLFVFWIELPIWNSLKKSIVLFSVVFPWSAPVRYDDISLLMLMIFSGNLLFLPTLELLICWLCFPAPVGWREWDLCLLLELLALELVECLPRAFGLVLEFGV